MAADDLPSEYDDIVVGTGVQESIVAAALARIGHRVLHLDRNDYYSGEWASFHLKGMLDWIEKAQSTAEDSTEEAHLDEGSLHEAGTLQEGDRLISVPPRRKTATNVVATVHIKDKPDEVVPPPEATPAAAAAASTEPETQEQVNQSDATTPAVEQSGAAVEGTSSDNQERKQRSDESAATSEQRGAICDDAASGTLPEATQSSSEETGATSSQENSAVDNGQSIEPAEGEEVGNQSSGSAEAPGPDEPAAASVATGNAEERRVEASDGDQGNVQENEAGAGQNAGPEVPNTGQAAAVASPSDEGRRELTWEDVSKEWRRFNIDLAPKLMFCRGSMVELLVSSRISRYAEFKAVTRILTHINDKLEQVPCSRADVFGSRYVTMLEKRMLMRLIEFCLDQENREDEYREYLDRPFSEFLKSRKLTKTLQHFVIHSIAMVTTNTPTQQALQAMQYFLRSLGRYGNTAFLWTLYGSGELPQCFCRMCAVFAGIYMLRTGVRGMIADNENNIKAIIDTDGRRLTCRNLIMEYSYAPPQAAPVSVSYVSRGILITDRSVKPSESEQITLLTIPPLEDSRQPVHVIEVGYAACAAPKNMYLVHLTSRASDPNTSAQVDLRPIVDKFFCTASQNDAVPSNNDEDDERPRILWSLFFSQQDVTEVPDEALREGLPSNIHITSGAGKSIGFDHAVAQAKRIFERICPGEEFLPAAPEPEDLVFEDPAQDNPGHSQAGFEQGKAPVEKSPDEPEVKGDTEGESGDAKDSTDGEKSEEKVEVEGKPLTQTASTDTDITDEKQEEGEVDGQTSTGPTDTDTTDVKKGESQTGEVVGSN